MADTSSLSGKSALVTGAGRGIGRAVAIAFAEAGAAFIVGIDVAGRVSPTQQYDIPTENDLTETRRLVEAAGARFLPLVCDQRDFSGLREAVQRAHDEAGRIDILAAIAGIQAFKPLMEMEDADWHDQIDVNLSGTANIVRLVAPIMARQGEGRIILTSSTQGQHGMRDGAAYSASKWGLFGLMKSAALELGEHNITVNCVIPGLIDTELTRNYARYAQAMKESQGKGPDGMPEPELEKKVTESQSKKIPLGVPFIPAEDVAGAYVYLASPAARLVTGTSLAVTGGDSAHNVA
jgi:NAD(P)-dependent dehydrogenase (short-subunit alcohol dehydrogenase family)